jgi:Mg-chelatase subunit ChlD
VSTISLPVAVDSFWFLGLLALAPLLWCFCFRSLAGLGRVRRLAVLLLRTAVLVLLIMATAEVQWVRTNDRLTVIYLLDQSASIPPEHRHSMIDYVNEAVRRHREGSDRAGVIVFGREANIEAPPFDAGVHVSHTIESRLDSEYTNLAGAVKLAQASFPADSARRIVVISDGNENIGSVQEQVEIARAAGISFDVFPITYPTRTDVAVEKLTVPTDIRKGQAFDMRVVLNNTTPVEPGRSGVLSGRLIVSEKTDDQPVVLSEQHIDLPPGKHVFTLRQQIHRPNFYSYEASFVPDDPADDRLRQNNRATAFTHVRGSAQVLLIEDYEHRGEFDVLVDRLRKDNIEVTVRGSNQLFNDLPELQPFDTVVLANVPREHFSDPQIAMLASNTQDLGCGLIMLGGPNSFGAGGWANTDVEKAMPVDFHVKNAKVIPSGALMLVLDCSGSMAGEKLEMSKVAAIAAVKVLGERDYVGVVAFDSAAHWIVPTQKVGDRDRIIARISRLSPGGGTDMYPGMEQGYRSLQSAPGAVKHMIVLTDGQTNGSGFETMANSMMQKGITTTCVAVGRDSAIPLLKSIARVGGGKFYQVDHARAIPRIFMKEATRVAQPLVYEDEKGFRPKLTYPHEMARGIEGVLPPMTGYVLTTVKDNPLVEVSIVSPAPPVQENATVLASWTYGLGKTVAFTTDAGARWTTDWTGWSNYDKLFNQMVRWSMRPAGDEGKYTVVTNVADGRVKVIVTALDKDDVFLNFLDLRGSVIGPEMARQPLVMKQTAPGRYIGEFETRDAGNYFMTLGAGAGKAPLRTGVNISYSPEFRDVEPNVALLTGLAARAPKAGPPGEVIRETNSPDESSGLLKVNSFRHDLPKATSTRDTWPLLAWLAACLFFADVFTRRVSVSLAWMLPLAARMRNFLLRRQAAAPPVEYLDRLRSRKAEVTQSLDQRRAAVRFDALSESDVNLGEKSEALVPQKILSQESTAASSAKISQPLVQLAPESDSTDDNYTSRLLKAKKKVWKDRKVDPR